MGLVILVVLIVLIAFPAAFIYKFAFTNVRGEFFDSKGTPIHYTVEGKGVPVILIHGFAVSQDVQWRASGFVRMLRQKYQVISMDVRGHGLSGAPHGTAAYGVEMVEDILRLMDHLRLSKAHIVGYSMGGFLVLSFVMRHPDRVLSCTAGGAGYFSPSEFPDVMQTLPDSLRAGKGMKPIAEYFTHPSGRFARIAQKLLDCGVDFYVARRFDAEALASCFESLSALEGTEEHLRQNTVPVLTVVGTMDPLKKAVENMVGKTPQHETLFLEGKDHLTACLDKRFRERLLGFLAEHSPAQTLGPA